MKIGCLGAGVWGFCLARLLSSKGYDVILWSRDKELVAQLTETGEHPFLPGAFAHETMTFTSNLQEAIEGVDLIMESVTSAGIRPVFEQIKSKSIPTCPIVITSKGIEQHSGLTMANVLMEVLGPQSRNQIAYLSGPSYAIEVSKGLPTSVVVAAYDFDVMMQVCETFTTPAFRVYPNDDVLGVAYGGALKNIIAIACGIAEGLGLGYSTKAAIMTRGLHEIRKLAVAQGCKSETLSGLSGMGDLCLTCGSLISRNCRYGYLIAQGNSLQEAHKQIGMVVEGAYTCLSAYQLSQKLNIQMPITETVYKILYEKMPVSNAVQMLMERSVKAEHL